MFSRRKSEKQNQVRWHILCSDTEYWVAELGTTVDLEQSLWEFSAEDADSVHSVKCSRLSICSSIPACKREDGGPPGSQAPQAGQRKASRGEAAPSPGSPNLVPGFWWMGSTLYLRPRSHLNPFPVSEPPLRDTLNTVWKPRPGACFCFSSQRLKFPLNPQPKSQCPSTAPRSLPPPASWLAGLSLGCKHSVGKLSRCGRNQHLQQKIPKEIIRGQL